MRSYTDDRPESPISNLLLDDVFGDDDASTPSPSHDPLSAHPSDMPSLQALHHTAGYREGFAEAKSTSVQAGFDEGYSLGASIGLRAGHILGVLGGVAEATHDHAHVLLLSRARAELATTGEIFGPAYWAPGGTWTFAVGGRAGKPDEEDGEVVFADVAEAHPLVRKWAGIMDELVERLGVDLGVLDGTAAGAGAGAATRHVAVGAGAGSDEAGEREGQGDEAVAGAPSSGKVKESEKKGGLDW